MSNYLVITGGSSGIGKSIANLFSENNWNIINISRSKLNLPNTIHYSADLSQPDWCDLIADDIKLQLKHATTISIVHNAAVAWRDSIQDLPATQLRQVLELNVIAPTILNQLVLPFMKKGSSIIYIGSTLSEKAVSNNASYITSKHAIAGLMKATCQDLDNTGIHTCCICPGLTDTPMLHERVNYDETLLDFFRQMSAAKRLIEPEEIAQLVWFCALHPVINGSMLHANLGQIEK